jgi:hypothetical protein
VILFITTKPKATFTVVLAVSERKFFGSGSGGVVIYLKIDFPCD